MRDTNKKILLVITGIVVFIVLLIIGTLFLGIRSILNILLFLLAALFILAIIGLIIYVVYYIWFKKHRFDATYQNKKSLIAAGKISKPQNLNDLYLSGDKGHSRVRVGKILGYCRIQVIKKIIEYDQKTNQPLIIHETKNPNKKTEKYTLQKEEQDVFIIQHTGTIMSFFTDPLVIRAYPYEHDDLIGDVTLYGLSLIPISEYHYLNSSYMDVRAIDYSIMLEANRGIFFEHLRDSKTLLDRAVGLDSEHKKEIEKKNLYEIPALPTQQPR